MQVRVVDTRNPIRQDETMADIPPLIFPFQGYRRRCMSPETFSFLNTKAPLNLARRKGVNSSGVSVVRS